MIMAFLPIQASRARTGALCTRAHAGACSLREEKYNNTTSLSNLRSKLVNLWERAERSEGSECRGSGKRGENLSLYISLEREKERSRENTLRARVHAHARERQEAGRKTRDTRKARGTRDEGVEDHKEEH